MSTVHLEKSAEVGGWTRDDWCTPSWVLDVVRRVGSIGLDPCSNAASIVNAAHEWTKEHDSLTKDWRGLGMVFVNPPYSRGLYLAFAEKIVVEARRGVEIVALVPANCETEAWRNGFWNAQAVAFLYKRVRFLKDGQVMGTSSGCSCLVYFGERKNHFCEVVAAIGEPVVPW